MGIILLFYLIYNSQLCIFNGVQISAVPLLPAVDDSPPSTSTSSCIVESWSQWSQCEELSHGCDRPSQMYRLRLVRPEACATSVDRRECFVPCQQPSTDSTGPGPIRRNNGSTTTTKVPPYNRPISSARSFWNTGFGGALIIIIIVVVVCFFIYVGLCCCAKDPPGNRTSVNDVVNRQGVQILQLEQDLLETRNRRDELLVRVAALERQLDELDGSSDRLSAAEAARVLMSPGRFVATSDGGEGPPSVELEMFDIPL